MIKTTSLVVLIGIVEVLKTGQQIIDANRFEYPTAALWVYGAVFSSLLPCMLAGIPRRQGPRKEMESIKWPMTLFWKRAVS